MNGFVPLMNRFLQGLILCFILQIGYSQNAIPVHSILAKSKNQLSRAVEQNKPSWFFESKIFPRSFENGKVITVNSSDWTSGFFPGCLWYMYEYSNDGYFKTQARWWTEQIRREKNNSNTHDLGFMLFSSFGNGYRLAKSEDYKTILIDAARSLVSRFNSNVGCIRSWDHGDWKFPVIIDNMMNLELLFWASKVTGDKSFYEMAVQHANHTMKNHFRKDGSSYHVVDYNPQTGKVISKSTAQGYSNESSWARGQAWGLYGFTMTYRMTHDTTFLNHAEKIANYFINHLPKNRIPYWDFNAPNIPFEFQDASAAAIGCSALLELCQYSKRRDHFFKAAEGILSSLCSPAFLASDGTNGNFILKGSVGNKRKNLEVNVPLIYSDYYFLEALMRYRAIQKKAGQ